MALDSDRTSERFYELIWPHRADVLRVARFLTRHPFEADDLAQEALLKAFRRDRQPARDAQGGPGLKPWLLTILRNTWVDRVRSAASRREVALGDGAVPPAAPLAEPWEGANPEELLNAFSDQQVIDALKGLPDEIRWTLLLVDVEGLGQQEAAEVLGVPTGTIKSRAAPRAGDAAGGVRALGRGTGA